MKSRSTVHSRCISYGTGTTSTRQPFEDVGGVFEFTDVAAGSYVVQSSFENCDVNGCTMLFTEQPLSVPSDAVVNTVANFAQLASARIEVRDEAGDPMPFENVDVEVQSLAAVGPFGGYKTQFNTNLDATGALTVGQLPQGGFGESSERR